MEGYEGKVCEKVGRVVEGRVGMTECVCGDAAERLLHERMHTVVAGAAKNEVLHQLNILVVFWKISTPKPQLKN